MTSVNWEIIAKTVAIPAFILSLWNVISPYFNIRLQILPEDQIQLAQGTGITGFNVLLFIETFGPSKKVGTFKMDSAVLKRPDNELIRFPCRSILREEGSGQKNDSRNMLLGVKGGEAKLVTFAFELAGHKTWEKGDYEIAFSCYNAYGNVLKSPLLKFKLDEKEVQILTLPNTTLIKKIIVQNG